LASLRRQTPLDVALDLYSKLPEGAPSEQALAVPVALSTPADLAAHRTSLEALVRKRSGIRRQVAIAALARLDTDLAPALQLAEQSPGGLTDAFKAAPLLEASQRPGLQQRAQQYLQSQSTGDLRTVAAALGAADAARWPRQAGLVASFERGEKLFPEYCSACHQPQGQGIPGAFPPLADSDRVKSENDKLIRIVMNGLAGPITVKGETYQSTMAPLGGVLNDQQIADVLTFVRHSWNNSGGAVDAEEVAAVRRRYGSRQGFWTVKELESK
ncbi:MAG: c-type cytochrome, partial [Solimonas sp.]